MRPRKSGNSHPAHDLIAAATAAGDVTIDSTDAAGLRESAAMSVDDNSTAAKIFEGVFQVLDPRNPNKRILATKNLSTGRSFYGEALVKRRLDGETAEFRSWDPFGSKLQRRFSTDWSIFHSHKERTACILAPRPELPCPTCQTLLEIMRKSSRSRWLPASQENSWRT